MSYLHATAWRHSLTRFPAVDFLSWIKPSGFLIYTLKTFRIRRRIRWDVRLLRSFATMHGPQRGTRFCAVWATAQDFLVRYGPQLRIFSHNIWATSEGSGSGLVQSSRPQRETHKQLQIWYKSDSMCIHVRVIAYLRTCGRTHQGSTQNLHTPNVPLLFPLPPQSL